MPTTKKVAPKAVSLKKDKQVVIAPKKNTAATSTIKSGVKKVVLDKKVSKIKIKDTTVAAIAKKKITPTIHSKKLHSKFSTLEALHSKNQSQQVKREEKVTTSLTKRLPLGLAILSPYRFPLDVHTQVIKTARYSGVFFVVLGAIFTLFFANGAFSVEGQMAQLTNALTQTVATSSTTGIPGTLASLNCQDPLVYQSLYCRDKVDIKPPASFDIANRDSDLKGTVKIKLNVSYAQRVKLMATNKNNGTSVELGLMKSISPDAWEFYWNTTMHTDAAYRLRVLVQNAHGSYEVVDTANVTVENTPYENSPTATSSTQNTDTVTESSVATQDLQLAPKLISNVTESENEFRFEITDPKAGSIKMYAFHVPTSKKMLLGNMYSTTNDIFKYRWLAGLQEPGAYKISAQILTDGVPTYSSELVVTKLGAVATLTTQVQNTSTEATDAELDPEVSIILPTSKPLASIVPVQIEVKNAALIELYIQGKASLVKKFVGVATMADIDTWSYRFDTKQVPNGEYLLIALVKNMYGSYEHKTLPFTISNLTATTYTPVQIDQIKTLETVAIEANKLSSTTKTALVPKTTPLPVVASDGTTLSTEPTPLLDTKQSETMQTELKLLANALRIQDTTLVGEIKARILKLKESTATTSDQSELNQQNVVLLDSYIRGLILETEEAVFKTDKLIAERTKEKASQDSDKDGVSNYDEVAIYKTDPFLSDTDSDGFGDAAEILSGYNPTDAKPEALVSYQSPKEAGIVREDIFSVTSITTEIKDEDQTENKQPVALISGTALPNSFITLYIFSTPIVVTLKTDEDGGWNYRFDKELEDGTHEVYIGVTDNAGKIVAKSNGFSFVKEAEAFTGLTVNEDVKPAQVVAQPSSFLSDYMVYLVLSISTVAIGLVLILLGLHLDSRQRKFGILEPKQDVLV